MAKLKFGAWIPTYAWSGGKSDPRNVKRIRASIEKCEDHGIDVWVIDHLLSAPGLYGNAWLEPLKSFGARRNTLEPVGSTDHLSFIEAGVPGFNPIQDYGNYDVRTHHTNMDTVDRVQVEDIRQAAAVMAWFAYSSAMRDEKIPRPAAR